MTVTELTVWADFVHHFEQINDRDILRVQRNLNKMRPDEKPLGVLHSEALKNLWVLADRYEGLAQQAVIDSEHKAETDEQAKELKQHGVRYAALEEIARSLFWAQAKEDIGAWGGSGCIGVREDWMMVSAPHKGSTLHALLAGIIRPPE
jgi:hypothetical protein